MMRIARFLGLVALLNLCSENTHPKESWQAILTAFRKALLSALRDIGRMLPAQPVLSYGPEIPLNGGTESRFEASNSIVTRQGGPGGPNSDGLRQRQRHVVP